MSKSTLQIIFQEPAVAYATTGNRLDLIALSRNGIKKQALLNLNDLLGLSLKEAAAMLPVTERTLQRRDATDLLSAAVSQQVILLAELTDKGTEVFGNTTSFRQWLREPNTALGGQQPLVLLDTAIGIQLITDQLGKLQYGVYS